MPYLRRQLRWHGHDYGSPGAYLVTVCTQGRLPLLSTIDEGGTTLLSAGQMVADAWAAIRVHAPGWRVDTSVVMPDHVHGILWLDEPASSLPLSVVIQRWKTFTTRQYADGVRHHGWRPFRGQLWQQSFHDRVIRGDEELAAMRAYIADNPRRWLLSPR
jgi:REP element-mobilizing transposase RayT